MLWLEGKFAAIIGGRFRNFEKLGQYEFRFSCPLCGDSRKNIRKARGHVYRYRTQDHLNFVCFNCNASTRFGTFLKGQDESLYNEMQREQLLGRAPESTAETVEAPKMEAPKFSMTWHAGLVSILELPDDHHAKKYVKGRLISDWYLTTEVLYAERYVEWAASVGEVYENVREHERLVIPARDHRGAIVGFQGRALGKTSAKYLSIKIADFPLVFGLDRMACHNPKRFFVVEGPIDGFFLRPSVATAGGDLTADVEELDRRGHLNKTDAVIVYDNEPRNQFVMKKLKKTIERGYKVVVWPESCTDKDINDMVLRDPGRDMESWLDENTWSGLTAMMKFNQWVRCDV